VPPYVIFSDKSLMEMSVSHPGVKEDLLAVHGVGDAKLKKYGDIFFDIIYRFRSREKVQSGVPQL